MPYNKEDETRRMTSERDQEDIDNPFYNKIP